MNHTIIVELKQSSYKLYIMSRKRDRPTTSVWVVLSGSWTVNGSRWLTYNLCAVLIGLRYSNSIVKG